MKKIVSAALVASMVAGAAFATDAKITLNYRSKLDAFSYRSTHVEGIDDDVVTQEWLDWEGYDGAGKQAATNSADTFKFVLNGERAGATFAVNVATNSKTSKDAALFTLNEYSAWMNWELGPGVLKIGSGNWKDGFADGAYRVKKDVDAQNAEGMDFEKFKLGSIFKGTKKLTFVDNLASGADNTALFSYADYGFQAGDAAKVNVLLGSVYNAFDTVVDESTTTYYDAFFVSRVQLAMEPLNAELIFKHPDQHVNDIALYFMPKVLDGLTLNVGGALEMDSTDGADYKDWAFDLRARYQATPELSVTFFTNVSGTDLEAGRKLNGGIVGRKGAYGYGDSAASDNATMKTNMGNVAFKTAMWNNLSARYKINDTLAATLNVGLITPLSKVKDDETKYGPEWRVTPAVQVYAGSNASVWAGVALSGVSVESGDYSVFNIDVPVIFRVKM